jgi:uncharacterized membrane protein YvbJ
MFCSHCGTPAADGAQFCAKCGSGLSATSASSAGAVLTASSAETPARTGASVPVGSTAQATSDLRDRTLLLWIAGIIAAIVIIVLAVVHYG